MSKPIRVQRMRRKGWKMPENTVCVDRSTKWGNPFVVGKHGTQAECWQLFVNLCAGYVCLSKGNADDQLTFRKHADENLQDLAGKNLACWCREGTPCHADVLLDAANR